MAQALNRPLKAGYPLTPAFGKVKNSWELHTSAGAKGSPTLIVHPDTLVRAVHCNGRHPSLPEGDQDVIYLMTYTPLSAPEDMKFLIRDVISKLRPPDLVLPSYAALRFFLSLGEPSTTGLHLLVGL